MKLEDLLIKRFTAKKINGIEVVWEDDSGNYKAENAEQVRSVLSDLHSPYRGKVEVLIGHTWHKISRNH